MNRIVCLCFLCVCLNAQAQENCIQFSSLNKYEKTGYVDTKPEPLFFFTPPEMRQYLSKRDAVIGEAFLTYATGGHYFFNLNIAISLLNAEEIYGFLPKGAALWIIFLDGKETRLYNFKEAKGKLNTKEGIFNYKAQYSISGAQLKWLQKKPIDKIKITWSSGYETYEIYNVDFLINHFNCLKQYINDTH